MSEATLPDIESTVEDAGPCRKKIVITVPAARVDDELNRAFLDLIRSANVPGFRVGHLPRRIAEMKFGEAVRSEVRGDIMEKAFDEILERHSLTPLGSPDLASDQKDLEIVAGKEFRFEVALEVRPEVKVPSLDGITVTRPEVKVTEEDMDRALRDLRMERAELRPVEDETVGEGDVLMLDAAVFVDGERIQDVENIQYRHPSEVVAGVSIKEFGARVLGKKVGDVVSAEVDLPANFRMPEYAGKSSEIRFTIREVKRVHMPEVDAAFASALDFDSVDELRAEVEKAVLRAKEDQADRAVDTAILDAIIERAPMELPDSIVKKEIGQVLSRLQADLHMQGAPEEVIEQRLAEVQADAAAHVAREFKVAFLVEEFARERSVLVTEGEVQEQVVQMAARYDKSAEEMWDHMESRRLMPSLRGRLRERKVLQILRREVTVS